METKTEPAPLAQIDPLLRLPAVEAATGLKKSSLYALMAANEFPGSVRLASRAVGWRASDVRAWIEARERAAQRALA